MTAVSPGGGTALIRDIEIFKLDCTGVFARNRSPSHDGSNDDGARVFVRIFRTAESADGGPYDAGHSLLRGDA
jgi:hypothetical protein